MHQNQKKRIILGVVQQFLALILAAIFGMLMIHSNIVVNNMYDEKVEYQISPFDTAGDYSNSIIFNQLLQNSIGDIETFAAIKGQMETNGQIDLEKKINVTDFVNRKNPNSPVSECPVSAEYKLGELIKWGRYGIETQTVNFQSKFDFLTYFGYENLITTVDDYGAYEAYGIVPPSNEQMGEDEFENGELSDDSDFDGMEEMVAYEKMEKYIQLVGGEDALYRAIVTKLGELGVEVKEIDRSGQMIIQITMLDNRYNMIDGAPFRNHCRNWEEYYMLQQNVIETIESISFNYNQYQKQNNNYTSEKTNFLFFVESENLTGEKIIYTNLPTDFAKLYVGERIKYIEEKGKYLYYSPRDMVFKTNTRITEKEMIVKLDSYNYALSENTRIWVCVDQSFPVKTDIFYLAKETYNEMIGNVWIIMIVCSICILGWIGIWLYISCYTGKKTNDEHPEYYTYVLDRIPLELMLAAVIVVTILVGKGYGIITQKIAEDSFNKYESRLILQVTLSQRYRELVITVGGLAISLFYSMIWYSFLRRWHCKMLWEGSALQRFTRMILATLRKMLGGKGAIIQTLMPYNIFVLFNIWSILWLRGQAVEKDVLFYLVVILMVLVDVTVGWWIFQKNLERNEIMKAAEKIGQGDIEYEINIEEMHGENIALGEAVNHVGEGIRKAVAKSVKDERMKTDLITNVSHDIKTPLTSIINYVNLMKREKIQTQPMQEYIHILDIKSQRLKQLTDDLVEASKISSGNIVLNNEKIDLNELIRQSLGEFSEKFEEKNLIPVFEAEGKDNFIFADSRRMWRVVENLLNNVAKYSMPGTRVYIRTYTEEEKVRMEIKNISANPLNIKAEELTERFIRGDVSRSTEGSGLGLSIVKGLVEVQQGEFILELDGDLFKVNILFNKYTEKNNQKNTEDKKGL